MPKGTRIVIGGVDTHGRTHHAAVLDTQGRLLGDRAFPADRGGDRQLLGWLGRHGQVGVVGQAIWVTSSCGGSRSTGLTDTAASRGRSDPIDAEAAARAVLAGTATAAPKRRAGSWSRSGGCAPPAAARSRPALRPSTSSRRCW